MARMPPPISAESVRRNAMIISYLKTHGATFSDDLARCIPMDPTWLRQGLAFLLNHSIVQKGKSRGKSTNQRASLGHANAKKYRLHPDFDKNIVELERELASRQN